MTVSQIREYMQKRVIPECVLPQNIAACLIDENAAPPELDAFTFLNRLRSLGIDSADFLYLLKGSGAPAEAVERIELHPDMNLQSLIVTLDSSGLTPKDYTRMLYTARQLWERTITMRIELEDEADTLEESEEQEAREEAPEPVQEQLRTARQKKRPDNEFREYAGVKPIGKRTERTEPDPQPDPDIPARPVKTARQKKKTEQEFHEYVGVKPIGRAGEQADISESRENVYTAVQLKNRDEINEPDTDEDHSGEQESKPAGSRGGIAAAAIGAVVLCALNAGLDYYGFSAPEGEPVSPHFAEDTTEIFSEIHTAYNADRIGGDVQAYSDSTRVFGDLLVDSGGQLGVFSEKNTVWAAETSGITVYDISDENAVASTEILPPEGAEFVRIIQTDGGITAIFDGEASCGAAGIGTAGQEWISQQCGQLTDIFCDEDIIRLGSVYSPDFTETFQIEDELKYLPWTSLDGTIASLLPGEIAVDGKAQGCSYAINVEYSADTGEIAKRTAALGNPVYSGAESFSAAMRQDAGAMLLQTDGEGGLLYEAVGEITACAYGNGLTASAEKSGDGSLTVYIRDSALKTISAFTAGDAISSLKFDGSTLLIGDGEKITMAADISQPGSPKPLQLTAASGKVCGEYALCGSTSPAGITLALYKEDNGKAVQADSFSKTLSSGELKSFRFIGANTAVISGTDLCGAAYSWFDGVSVVDEFAVMGKNRSVKTMFDDKQGFTAAVVIDGELKLIAGNKIY